MKRFFILSILSLLFSCSNQKAEPQTTNRSKSPIEIQVPAFQDLLDSSKVTGSILIYDLEENRYYSNDFEGAKKGNLPASTFKITNSIIALETGVMESDSTLIKWNGESRRMSVWEQDLSFKEAFHFSCVPCYQNIARTIGPEKMNTYLSALDYGQMEVDSSNIDIFWLEGHSTINAYQQIDFLRRFYQSELPISERTESIMKRLMVIEENPDFKISGKTGWSIRNGNNNGWFVGYLEAQGKTYIFATNIDPEETFNMSLFNLIRKEVSYQAFKEIDLIE